jgi:sugar O-acyltransferase (sialic acid O-acetyltransferase NeuD family)
MKTVYILGAGGFGRELYWWLMQSPENGKAWKVAGFLDDNAEALKAFDYPVKVVGSVMGYRPQPGDLLACAITQPKVKKPVVESLLAKGAEFLTFVHPKAHLGGKVKIGRGTIICPGVILTCDIAIGDFTTINVNSTVGHDARVGHFCLINSHSDITGFCTVGDGVILGTHANLIPHSKVGDGATIGANATVVTPVEAGVTVVGNPATKLR